MGVHGLWELLAPVGRRVSVETLSGKKLAIDASIWMIQFMKAMRDERGEMVKNAHLLGFFRRICKLLFLRTKPVFVFDGGTPVLKRRTVIARRRQRENAQAKIRKTAEKLLLNHLKAMNLKALASGIGNLKQNDAMCKKALPNISNSGDISTSNEMRADSFEREKADKLLAATLAAEEGVGNTGTTSDAEILSEEDSDGEDEEMILPAHHGKIDPAVLAALPPSMQLDLLVQMRERLMAENRQKYQRVKKAPTKFSELQVESYLKTVAFRREIDSVQKSASGRGAGGVRVSRIASEANKEFIFSSSFSGDKGILTHGNDSHGINRGQFPSEQSSDKTHFGVPSSSNDVATTVSSDNAPRTEENFGNDNTIVSCLGNVLSETEDRDSDGVETYLDDRGRTRVSRVKALGIRMTRDLERNLNLMKEIDHGKNSAEKFAASAVTSSQRISGVGRVFNRDVVNVDASNVDSGEIYNENDGLGKSISNDRSEPIIPDTGFTIELSFGDHDESNHLDADDIMFASLVSGSPLKSPVEENQCEETPSDSDFDWEKEAVDVKRKVQCDDFVANVASLHGERAICSGSDVEWEDGGCDDDEDKFSSKTACNRDVSRGALEEDADLREAIRRSLEDFENPISSPLFPERKVRELASKEESLESSRFVLDLPSQHILQQDLQLHEVIGDANLELKNEVSNPHLVNSLTDVNIEKVNLKGDVSNYSNRIELNEFPMQPSQGVDRFPAEICQERFSSMIEIEDNEPSVVCSSDARSSLTTAVCCSADANISSENFKDKFDVNHKAPCSTFNENLLQELDDTVTQREGFPSVTADGRINFQYGSPDVNLEEEMHSLEQECLNLADEQKKLERNVDIASSEMFAECQELLQMFGLPYIIAPMEAEAQCAYMELVNLVDGVVTDDSDAFLFGARSIYKNIFDDRKYVETYFMKDIESELGLSREKLIHMALLLGSDYTEGISGIGIVNATEVVNAFPEENGLNEFREWIESPDPSILKKVTEQTKSMIQTNGANHCCDTDCPETNNDTFANTEIEVSKDNRPTDEHVRNGKQQFMNKHRKVSKNWHIPTSFPSEAVIAAYACPQVDKSMEPFSWGKPDHFALRKMSYEKFGWVNKKADDILIPVLNEYNKNETQLRLEAFYTFNERFAKIRSNRIKKAVKGITGKQSAALMDEDAAPPHSTSSPKQPRKRKASSSCSDVEESLPAAATGVTNVRRSLRQRKTVNYKMMDEDIDDANESNRTKASDGTELEDVGCNEEKSKVTPKVGNDDGLLPSSSEVGPCSPDYLASGGGFCMEEDSSTRVGKQAQEAMVVNPLTPLPSLRRKRRKS